MEMFEREAKQATVGIREEFRRIGGGTRERAFFWGEAAA
jgi:hypothetical protein